MSQMSILLVLIGLMSPALASLSLHGQPLLSGVTSYALAIQEVTEIKPTTCYITSGEVTQCRRKRGMVERPIQYNSKGKIVPSAVVAIETTPLPRDLTQKEILAAHNLFSSMDDSYYQSQNVFKQMANRRRSNVITVGNCGMSTVNLVEFLSCLGMTVQETTTLTATFTETHFSSSGYTVMTVMGCTPAGFPYLYCPANLDEQPTKPSNIILEEETVAYTTTITSFFPDGSSSIFYEIDQTVITEIAAPSQEISEPDNLPSTAVEETIETEILPSAIDEETITQTTTLITTFPDGTGSTNVVEITETIILPSATNEETIETTILPSATNEETIQTTILPSITDETIETTILPSVAIEQSTITNTVLTIVQTTVTTVSPTSTVSESSTTVTVDTEPSAPTPEIESSSPDEPFAP